MVMAVIVSNIVNPIVIRISPEMVSVIVIVIVSMSVMIVAMLAAGSCSRKVVPSLILFMFMPVFMMRGVCWWGLKGATWVMAGMV